MNGKISNLAQLASIRRYTMTEGRAKGTDVIDCDNGKIRFLLNVSCALDVMQLYHEGQNMSFLSKNAFTSKDLDFLRRFEGGMVYTCGLDSAGGREGFELHGSFHKIPAEVVRAECTCDGIVVEALVRDTGLFGKNLVLRRRITSALGSEEVKLEDTLINEGFAKENYCLLYHINVGYPMLDAGAKVIADIKGVTPRSEWAAKNQDSMLEMTECVDGAEETCYFLQLAKPEISLVNEKINKKFTVFYSGDTLTNFLEWKSMASGDYALGLEPCTTDLDDYFKYKVIGAKEKIVFSVSIKVERI